ncbi:ribonuclease H-like domain-containing protein [Armillaria mellea]|nr:ribonuclease H-like domain-containing protein [Armillaria mellea]
MAHHNKNAMTTIAAPPVRCTRRSPPDPYVEPTAPLPTCSRSCMHAEVPTMSAMTLTLPTEEMMHTLAPSRATVTPVPGIQATFRVQDYNHHSESPLSPEAHTVSLSLPPPPAHEGLRTTAADSLYHVDHADNITQAPVQTTTGSQRAHFEDDLDSSGGEFPELVPSPSPSVSSHAETSPGQAPMPRTRAESPHVPPQTPSRTPRRLFHAASGLSKKGHHTAQDVWSFFSKTEGTNHAADFENNDMLPAKSDFGLKTSTDVLRRHLLDHHLTSWLTKCDRLGIQVCSTQKHYQDAISKFYIKHGKQPATSSLNHPECSPFSHEAFIDALIAWIIADDQSINVIESPHLHSIFLMLREELKDSDIPHRTSLQARILEMWDKYVNELASELKASVLILPHSCFPHIVNLACHEVEKAMNQIQYNGVGNAGALANLTRDPVSTLRTLIKSIRSSSLRCATFSEKVMEAQLGSLQLLRDVEIHWSSTDIMIERAILLRQPIRSFLQCREQRELQKHQLSEDEWTVLNLFHEILRVPHAFQQHLSAEKTPTLCNALPSFSALILRWHLLKEKLPEMKVVISAGLKKLEEYFAKVVDIPVYIFSMILNPNMKLHWYEQNDPTKIEWVQDLFIHELQHYSAVDPMPTVTAVQTHDWADEILGLNMPATNSAQQTLEQEFNAYLLDCQTLSSSLLYWQENCSHYPTIFLMAMDILPIQGSSVPSLQMLKFSLKKGMSSLNFTGHYDKGMETTALEHLLDDEALILHDINEFIDSLDAFEAVFEVK